MGDGTAVPVDETDDAEDPDSQASSIIGSSMGASGGNLANFDLAKDFWRSLISSGYFVDHKRGTIQVAQSQPSLIANTDVYIKLRNPQGYQVGRMNVSSEPRHQAAD